MRHEGVIGTYLGRPVSVLCVNSEADCRPAVLGLINDAAVLVYVEKGSRAGVQECLTQLIASSPVAISVAGENTSTHFDDLLNALSERAATPHVMSSSIEGLAFEDAAAEFFQATWPADERFDEWQRYAVIVFGCDMGAFYGARLRELLDDGNSS